MTFDLFRLKLVVADQPALNIDGTTADIDLNNLDRPALLERLLAFTQNEIGEIVESRWKVGNLTVLEPFSIYFRFGKLKTAYVEVFAENKFIGEDMETSPFTHVFIDTQLGVLAVANRPALAKKTFSISKQLIRLMQESARVLGLFIEIEAEKIRDPEDLVRKIDLAERVEVLKFSFSRPNPFDVNKEVVAPLEQTLSVFSGRTGEYTVEGEDLDKNVVSDVVRSAASTGGDASAKLVQAEGRKSWFRLNDSQSRVQVEDIESEFQKFELMARIRILYGNIRNGGF